MCKYIGNETIYHPINKDSKIVNTIKKTGIFGTYDKQWEIQIASINYKI